MGARIQRTLLFSIISFCSISALIVSVVIQRFATAQLDVIFVAVSSISLVASGWIALLSYHVYQMEPSDSLPLLTILKLYFMYRSLMSKGRKIVNKYLEECKRATKYQEEYLLTLLKHNSETIYGKEYKFGSIDSVESFRQNHPLCNYDHYKPYVDRICEGEKHVLSKDDLLCLAKTSGTTGEGKRIPITMYKSLFHSEYMNIYFFSPVLKGGKFNLKKILTLGHKPKIESTNSGIKVGPVSYFYSQHLPYFVSPACAFDATHESISFYIHSLFALKEKEIGCFSLVFAHQVYCFFMFLENNWQQLCKDLEKGCLSAADLELDETLRKEVEKRLKPDPVRAEEVREEFMKGADGLALRLWPGLSYCRLTTTGSMKLYTKFLQDSFLKGVVLVPNGLAGSEGLYGLNISEDQYDQSYYMTFMWGFFEFIPEEHIDDSDPKTFVLAELKKGQSYELVVTNGHGLYRYRVGDVLKVVGYHHQCPIVEFEYRTGQILNILGEKTTESVLYEAVTLACKNLDVVLSEYAACEDLYLHGIKVLDDYKRHYVLFVELDRVLADEEKEEFDAALKVVSEIYFTMRSTRQSIAPMEIVQVKNGTFLQLKEKMIEETQNPQFKLPRALRNSDFLQFLYSNKT